MFFNLKNEFNMFQHYINNILHEFLDVFVTTYINNILIYSNFLSEHQKHIWLILEQLQEADLQCDIWKCKFHASEVTYLDLIVFQEEIKMNSIKVEAILSWKSLQNVHDVQSFLEFVNFYQWFIKNFSKIVWSLMNLIKKTVKFTWNVICEHIFNNLKKWFTTALIFTYFNSDFKCILEADLSDHAQENVLS